MALNLFSTFPISPFITHTPKKLSLRYNAAGALCCHQGPAATKNSDRPILRRSANYQPPIWDYDYIQSLRNEYVGESYTEKAVKLKGQVKMMLEKLLSPLDKLGLIDTLERLGLSYHFGNEISGILKEISESDRKDNRWKQNDLYATALEFRLLRQHGYNVPQEVFNIFKDEHENFKTWFIQDTKGMLSLYEASYLSVEGETFLEEARSFASEYLREWIAKTNEDHYLLMLVTHALELPLHWRMPRSETRWFIDAYEKKKDRNPIVLELAKVDFNTVQAIYQEDLKYASRWWRNIGFGEKLSFARDRLVENFLWGVGFTFQPQFSYCRRMVAKLNSCVTLIDDVYDVYGTLDELELFTEAVERWDIVSAMEQLPDYMKLCFLFLYNFVNELAFDILKEQGANIIPYLQKVWADLCKSYLLEAKWYYSRYIPTLEEYIDNAWISMSAPLQLMHIYTSIANPILEEELECLNQYPDSIRSTSTIFRLLNDLATSSDELKRGDIPKSIQCYMHETGASNEDARDYIKHLIRELWKKMNEDQIANIGPFSKTFTEVLMNMARTSKWFYEHGDGYGAPNTKVKNHVQSIIANPINPDV